MPRPDPPYLRSPHPLPRIRCIRTRNRFLSLCVVDENGLLTWTGAKDRKGYGRFWLESGHVVAAHRVAYALFVGPIPPDLHIHHKDGAPPDCVDPRRLMPLTPSENSIERHTRRPACDDIPI